MTMTVLVLASESDRTADGVVSGLTERGIPVMRLDLSWFPQRLTLDAEFRNGSWKGQLRTEYHEVDLGTVRSVWVRTPSSFRMPEGMSAAERDFAKRPRQSSASVVCCWHYRTCCGSTGPTWPRRPSTGRCSGRRQLGAG